MKVETLTKALSFLLPAALRGRAAHGAEVYQVIYPSFDDSFGDAVIFSDQPDQAAGGSDLIVGCNNNMQCARSLLHFSVDGLPDDAVVTDVLMTLLPAASVAEGAPSMTMDLHQVTSTWSRTTDSVPDGERDTWDSNLAGNAAADGDVTWKYAVYPDTEWTTEGGDVNAEVLTSVESKGWSGRGAPLFFPMTDAFQNLVQEWIAGTTPNYGVLVKRDTEDPSDTRLRILFHEQSGNKNYRSPKLLITYTSVSQPEQMASPPSGPGILLPGETTKAPTTSSPTTAPACPLTAMGVKTFTGTSSEHASIFKGKGGLSQDKGAFGVGIVHSGEILRALVKFPVDSIPAGATVTCAEIIMKTTGPCGPCKGVVDVEMHQIISGWTTTGTNDFMPQKQPLLYQVELEGAGANTGDVTWTHSTYDAANPDGGGTKWGTEGGDVNPLVISMEVDNERGQHKFPSSPGFVAAIQSFVDGAAENHGFLFKTDESDEYVAMKAEENTYSDYDTAYRLFKSNDEEAEADRPLLVVHYTTYEVDMGPATCPDGARTFKDDRGVTHCITGKPKIAVRAGVGGVSLYHMGLPQDQLTAVWGLWGTRGSNFDPENPEIPSDYPGSDPGVEEVEWLSKAVNLSPSCWKNIRGCSRWDNVTDVYNLRDQIDYVLYIDNGNGGGDYGPEGNRYNRAEELGMKVIFIDTFFEYHPDCRAANYDLVDTSKCYAKSMIDITQRIEELAFALVGEGILPLDKLNAQKQQACDAALSFTQAMEDVHERGIRVMVSIAGTETDEETGLGYATIRAFDPIQLWIPRTLEELGMPLLHANTTSEIKSSQTSRTYTSDTWFVDCSPGLINETCSESTAMPVDFWLIDGRSYRIVEDSSFTLLFPDKAMLAGQVWQYPRNDGALSYVRIKSYLSELTSRLSTAVRQHEPTECVEADPKSLEHIVKDGGLDGSDYICYNFDLIQDEYLKCPAGPGPTTCQLPNNGGPGVTVRVDFTFDTYPQDTSWTLSNTCSGSQVEASGGPYEAGDDSFTETYCVPDGTYDFTVKDAWKDGFMPGGDYTVSKNGVEMISYGASFTISDTQSFGSAVGCTVPACQLPNNGGPGVTVRVDFTFDTYPQDTSWTLSNTCSGSQVEAFGGPYTPGEDSFTQTYCVPDGKYEFTVKDAYNDGFMPGGDYTVSKNGVEMISYGASFTNSDTQSFGTADGCPAVPAACQLPNNGGLGVTVRVDFTFDTYPEDTSWTLSNTCSGSQVEASGGPYMSGDDSFTETYCVPDGTYDFTVNDEPYNDGFISGGDGDYTVSKNGVEMISYGASFTISDTQSFGRVDGCSQAPGIAAIRVDFTFDTYPEDTSWILTNTCCGGDYVVAVSDNYAGKDPLSKFSQIYIVPDGTFNFEVLDSYDDGICCGNGDGDYSVYRNGAEMIAMDPGSNYLDGETQPFGSPSDCTTDIATIRIDFTLVDYPGDISWKLFNTCKGGNVEVAKKDNYGTGTTSETVYVQDGIFELIVTDYFGDGMATGSYSAYRNGVEMVSMEAGFDFGYNATEVFGSGDFCA